MAIIVTNQAEYDAVEFRAEVEYQGSTFIKFFDELPESSHAERDSQSEISADYRLCYICMEPGHDKDRQYLAKKYSVSINTVSDLFSLGSDLFSGMSPDTRHADYLDVTRSLDMVPSKAAAALGSVKSPRKAATSRANGAKGGRPMSTTSAIEKIQNGAEPESLRFTCEADDGQGNSYWVRRQGATIIRLNRFQDNETGAIEWSDDVSGWEK